MQQLFSAALIYGLDPVPARRLPGVGAVAVVERRPRQRRGWRILSHHRGLHYVLADAPAAELERRLGAPAWPARDLRSAIDGLRAGVRLLRDDACAAWRRRLGRDPSFADELAARAAMLAEARRGHAGAACERWCDIVCVRHRSHLFSLRRRFAQLPALLSAGLDAGPPLGRTLERLSRRLDTCFRLHDLRAWSQQAIADLAPHLLARWRIDDADDPRLAPQIAAALRWLRANHLDPVRPGDAARALRIPAPRLAGRFRRDTGATMTDALRAMRVASAQELLAGDPRSVTAIALACGFNGTDQFIRAFRRLVGVSPGRWRRDAAASA